MPSVDELYDEAISLQQQGKMEEAISKLDALLEQDPEYALAHAALSVFYGKLDRHDEAVEYAAKVCELDPEDPFSYMAMSLICQKAGRLKEAETATSQAMEKQWATQQGGQG